VRLRNRLIHQDGALLLSSADKLDAILNGDRLEIRMQIPESPWKSVTRSLGTETVADVSDYLEDLDRFRDQLFLRESDFLARTISGSGAG